MDDDDISNASMVYQFYIAIAGIEPTIWRTVRVLSTSSIADLHFTIQLLMKWSDCHLHRFVIGGGEYGIARVGGVSFNNDAGVVPLSHFQFKERDQFLYEYDFGDCWEHVILVEAVLRVEPRVSYPLCTGGRRAGPPEDCGGPWGFMSRYNKRRQASGSDRFDRRAVNTRLKQYARGNENWRLGLHR